MDPSSDRGPGCRIAPAVAEDAAGIAAVHVAVWRSAYAGILPARVLLRLSVPRLAAPYGPRWGEVETLYVHDDWRDQGIGRSLLARAAASLRRLGCGALFLHVLADNNSRWFYRHLGGRAQNTSVTYVGGRAMAQGAMVWDPIGPLADLA